MKLLFHERVGYYRIRKMLLLMRLTVFLLLVFTLATQARGVAQKVTLSVTNMPIEKVIKEIDRQTGYNFVYAKDLGWNGHLISLKVDGAGITETLRMVFDKLPYSYQIIDKVVVINTLKKTVQNSEIPVSNGELIIKVEGIVLSDQGQPLDGATIMVKKTGRTTITNIKGEFSLSNVPAGSVLVISYAGYSSRQVIAKEGERIQVKLDNSGGLDAMVIKGYYNTSNRLNTGNAVTVKGEDIRNQPVSDPILALEGKVAGLNITQNTGLPGAYSIVRLRGQNSIANGLDPLYIVDGVPYNNVSLSNPYIATPFGIPNSRPGDPPQNNGGGISPFNNLNPNDIESITVLKDADATAIYGSRGANGVILITTHKGNIGQTKVDINAKLGGSHVTRGIKLLNTAQYLEMRREAFQNDGVSPNPNVDFDLTYWDKTRYTDWQKVLIGNTAQFSNVQANISGGNSNTQFLVGLGYNSQGTVFPGNYIDRKISGLINISNTSTNQKFHTDVSFTYSNDNNKLPVSDLSSSINLAPNTPKLFTDDGNINWEIRNGTATFYNPLATTRNSAQSITNNMIGSITLSYTIFPGLKISNRLGYTSAQMNQSNLTLASSFAPPNNNNSRVRSNVYGVTEVKAWIEEPQINYDLHFLKGILQATVGSTFQENNNKSFGQGASNFVSDALVQNPLSASTTSIKNFSVIQYRYNAAYFRIGYNYMEKYLINLTARRDGSSRFGPGKQFGNFGAIGTGWLFSNENCFQKNLPSISFGKLRASYGVSGNDQLPDYKYLDTYTSTGASYQNIAGLSPTQITNPYYAWESVKKLEVALELGFFKDRLFLSLAYYRNRTNNQLVGYALPYVAGFQNVQANLPAIIQNKGMEFVVNSVNYKTKNFTWNTSLNLSIPRNRLLAYPNLSSSAYSYTYSIGRPLSIQYLYHYNGVNPETGLYSVATKNGGIDPTFGVDQYFSKAVTQDFQGGISNSISYRKIQFDIFIQFVKQLGYDYSFGFDMPGLYNMNIPLLAFSRWKKFGDLANVQRFSQTRGDVYSAYSNRKASDAILTDASFIRVKNISLSYTLPQLWLKNHGVQNLRVYLQAQNLFTITKYVGVDPENQGLGLPPLRTIVAGIQITL